jgi:hypothetical protein
MRLWERNPGFGCKDVQMSNKHALMTLNGLSESFIRASCVIQGQKALFRQTIPLVRYLNRSIISISLRRNSSGGSSTRRDVRCSMLFLWYLGQLSCVVASSQTKKTQDGVDKPSPHELHRWAPSALDVPHAHAPDVDLLSPEHVGSSCGHDGGGKPRYARRTAVCDC